MSFATLSDMLRHQVGAEPDRTCVIGARAQLSFAALHDQASQLAGAIAQSRAEPATVVGLYCDPSVDLICAAWGILVSGRAYLPLAADYPDERIRFMIEDSEAKTVVTQPHLAQRLRALAPAGTDILVCAEIQASAGAAPASGPPDTLAYLLYTSGSTGRPKGVMIEQRNIVAQMEWLLNAGYLTAADRILQKTPMSFDASVWEILAPAVGATVVAGRPNVHRDPAALVRLVRDQGVTSLQCVPTLLQALLEQDGFAGLASLRSVFSGGEALSTRLAREVLDALPGRRLVNLYGPTECTINATAHEVTPEDLGSSAATVPIGRTRAALRAHLLDDRMQPVPDGETGELYLEGPLVGRGYWGRPEETAARFLASPFAERERVFRTGDLCSRHADGTLRFVGRNDNQVKLRGYRVELDEVARAIEAHHWVRHAVAVVATGPRTKRAVLSACVELKERDAVLMDRDLAGAHHRSKTDKRQVRAQLADLGVRNEADDAHRPMFALPGHEETAAQRSAVFKRKSYRFYEGGSTTVADVQRIIEGWFASPWQMVPPLPLTFRRLGTLLRWFGRFTSRDRLLPKYAYASPGALYATRLHVECRGIPGLAAGIYYYHPVRHWLVKLSDAVTGDGQGLRLHFAGKRQAIEPVYVTNIREVLEIETGHMLGVLGAVLRDYGFGVRPAPYDASAMDHLDMAVEDLYLGAVDCVPAAPSWRPAVDLFVQPAGAGVSNLEPGTYRATPQGLERVSTESLGPTHVIAINQPVFARASVGISTVSREADERLGYLALGHALHRFQAAESGFGFMSAGYSSKSGQPLPAAVRLDEILRSAGARPGASYFFVGGKISEEQWLSEGMKEDAVHMKGPAELIRDELARMLPDYMVPSTVHILPRLPRLPNGKIDRNAVDVSLRSREPEHPSVSAPPEGPTEERLAELWSELFEIDTVSRADDFFVCGGDSLIAVSTILRINETFGVDLPVQAIFEAPRLCDLAARIEAGSKVGASRLVPLNAARRGRPIFCWPGLGGYPMNLRSLAHALTDPRPFYGVQALGINAGEIPFASIAESARADLAEIDAIQPEGPLTLWGYSFGARSAFETAWHFEQCGREVDHLALICPGNPTVATAESAPEHRSADLTSRRYVAVLLSVFLGRLDLAETDHCLSHCTSWEALAEHVHDLCPELPLPVIRRIMALVGQTYEYDYNFEELQRRRIRAPITIVKARGDDYSFIENTRGFAAAAPKVVRLNVDHYDILKGSQPKHLVTLLTL